MNENINDTELKIVIDKELENWESSARRPYFQLRGKPITQEQAMDIIRRTDSTLNQAFNGHKDAMPYCIHFGNGYFFNNIYPRLCGWVHPDGTIGKNDIMGKYPDMSEVLEEWVRYGENFPYLDLVAGITDWNEMSAERWAVWSSSTDEYKKISYEKYEDFTENLDIVIWLRDGVLEIMTPERGAKIYEEYEKKYEVKNTEIYFSDYYDEYKPDIVDMDYFRKCVAAYGVKDPDKFIKENIEEWKIKHLKEKTHG